MDEEQEENFLTLQSKRMVMMMRLVCVWLKFGWWRMRRDSQARMVPRVV